jgi:hypothetical protein
MGSAYGIYGEKRNAYKIMVWKPNRKRPLQRSGQSWENNAGMHLIKRAWQGTD